METALMIHQLEMDAQRIAWLVHSVSPEQARWRPEPSAWSMLEVVNHLYEEEQYDFRVRIDFLLHRPGELPPAIDPQGWVTERRYNERELEPSLQNFLDERRKSLEWLRSLQSPHWETVFTAEWGSVTAGEFLASWAAHDLLHMRQLVELHYLYTVQAVAPFSVQYAGGW
jgi:hypothetical protein